MQSASLITFTTLEPRPVAGSSLRTLCKLDTASPYFHSHVLTASALKRQSIFAALAELQRNACAAAEALGTASGIQCNDPYTQSARSLVVLKPAQILNAIYGVVPDGLIGTMKRIGHDPLDRLDLYRDLFRLFAEPEQRDRSDLVRQYSGQLTEERLEIALHLDAALIHQRAYERVDNIYEVEQANAAVRLIQATVTTASTFELQRSLVGLPQTMSLQVWANIWLRRLDKPLAGNPVFSNLDLGVLKVSDLRAASKQFRNCLRERILHVASGRDAYVVSAQTPGLVAELRRTSDSRWALADIWAAGNERPDQQNADKLRRTLEAEGVISLMAAVPQAELDLLAEFFDAFDLMGGWPPPRRTRQRLVTVQEAA